MVKENNLKEFKLIIQILPLDVLEKYALKLAFETCEDVNHYDNCDEYNYEIFTDNETNELKFLNMYKDIICKSLIKSFKIHLNEAAFTKRIF